MLTRLMLSILMPSQPILRAKECAAHDKAYHANANHAKSVRLVGQECAHSDAAVHGGCEAGATVQR